jgi:type I restriction enzyme R subunit
MPIEELEWQTRKERIDRKLRSLSSPWIIEKHHPFLDTSQLANHAIEEYPTENGPADYALFVEGKLLGIIEAKKVSVNPQNVLEQAKRYSKGISTGIGSWGDYGVPFLYSTNGEYIWHIDIRNPQNLSRKIADFPTPEGLKENFEKESIDESTFRNLQITNEKLRDYQKDAIEEIEKAIIEKKRRLMIAMATGTGKTYTLVSLIYRLLESKHFKRILFLVDRRALAAQAVREFRAFDTPSGNKFSQEYEVYSQKFQKEDFDEKDKFDPQVLPTEYLTKPDSTKTFVYVTTIQRMTVNLFGWENAFQQDPNDPDYEEDAEELNIPIPIHAFDLIIADECHRGYTAKDTAIWRKTLDHFDAIKIGLTATPAVHTSAYFGQPVYRYTTDQAVQDGYLVDYEAVKIKSDVLVNGAFLKEGELVGIVDKKTGHERLDNLEDEREFDSSQIENDITVPDTNKKVIEELAKYAYAHEEEYGHFPKILIFACNDLQFTSHADQIVSICKEVFNRGDDFVIKITGNPNVDRPLQKIREFRNRPNPKIVVTVDMLSTGVDIPALEFVVFMRPVKSRILWVQMLGRGTRLCPEIGKDHFKIFDCFNGSLIEYFKDSVDFKVEPPRGEPLSLEEIINNIYQNVNRDYYTKILVKRLKRIEKNMSGEAIEYFEPYVENGDIGKFADDLSEMIRTDFVNTMNLLRDKEFVKRLKDYPRKTKEFWKGYEIEDTVESEELILGEKPQDYLDSFSKFVKENPDKILALKILLEKPNEWNPNVLNELRDKLKENKFTEKDLRRAHKLVYNIALTDLISMIKHAANESSPLLSPEERVRKAIVKVTEVKNFTYEQLEWLSLIQKHLAENLSIDEKDFDYIPAFERKGGLKKAQRIFGKTELQKLIEEINSNIAA